MAHDHPVALQQLQAAEFHVHARRTDGDGTGGSTASTP